MFIFTILAAETINLEGAWNSVWDPIKTSGPGFTQISNLMAAVGVMLVVAAVVKWLWDKRRSGGGGGGGGQGSSAIMWALLLGCLFTAPDIIIPAFLMILDVLANALHSIWIGTTKK